MTSRIPLATSSSVSNQSEVFHPVHNNELTEIYAATPFSLSGHLQELRDMGVAGYLIDLRGHSAEQRYAVLQAIHHNQQIKQTTLFNYQRGLN